MNRFHIQVAMPDLAAQIRFHSTPRRAEPSVTEDNCASAGKSDCEGGVAENQDRSALQMILTHPRPTGPRR